MCGGFAAKKCIAMYTKESVDVDTTVHDVIDVHTLLHLLVRGPHILQEDRFSVRVMTKWFGLKVDVYGSG